MPSPVDPRRLLPSHAEPKERHRRKQLEKEHAVGLKEVAVLGLIGLTLAWDIDKQVRKKEEQKEKEEAEQKKREEREERERRRTKGVNEVTGVRRGATLAIHDVTSLWTLVRTRGTTTGIVIGHHDTIPEIIADTTVHTMKEEI
ncbi:hypothetical protein F4801DRAFT_580958 [Xylaria longipes]|nr:hypothetical protein F4801DRAFT_580958 [Xylaria longipes]